MSFLLNLLRTVKHVLIKLIKINNRIMWHNVNLPKPTWAEIIHKVSLHCSKLNQRTLHQRNHTNTHHCLLQLATSPTLPQQISSMETVLSTLQQLNLLSSTHYTQWSTMSCTHSSLDYYPVKVKKYMTVKSTYSRPLVNNINLS